MYMIYDMMAGCQVGRDPSMLAAYNYISLIVNTIQRKKTERKTKHNKRIMVPVVVCGYAVKI